ncbi:MAG: response regulator transcription factor [Phormidesmis sp. CAN_BIN44]|nr:response regulator transcription factor [Phormidesmis sp. CAN_BIN44]
MPGLTVLHPDVMETLLPVLPATTRPLSETPIQALTSREVEVLGMLAEGLGNKTIARRLTISEHTVKFHISSIFSKLNASSRTEAVILGARQGLIFI